jgi:amino acid permease
MLASALGTGCLNLPFRVSELGIIPFVIEMTLVALLSYFGMYMMERMIIKYKVVSYAEMVRRAFGTNVMQAAQALLVLFPWGCSICIQVIFAKFALQVMHDVLGLPLYTHRDD